MLDKASRTVGSELNDLPDVSDLQSQHNITGVHGGLDNTTPAQQASRSVYRSHLDFEHAPSSQPSTDIVVRPSTPLGGTAINCEGLDLSLLSTMCASSVGHPDIMKAEQQLW